MPASGTHELSMLSLQGFQRAPDLLPFHPHLDTPFLEKAGNVACVFQQCN